jgi:RNA polymerase sigma-70 factor (ECF subfamily)
MRLGHSVQSPEPRHTAHAQLDRSSSEPYRRAGGSLYRGHFRGSPVRSLSENMNRLISIRAGQRVQPARPPRATADDAALVERAKQRDATAEELLYRTHADAVAGLAVRLLGRTTEAEDVVQDAFISALSRLHQLRDGQLFRAWLLRITVHQVHRRFRRRKLLRALGLDRGEADATLAALAQPGLTVEQRAELAALDRVLDRLPSRERVAWVLRHVEGHELTDIARACDASLATIKRWLAKADAQVRAHVASEVEP